MKKTLTTVIAILAAMAIILSLAACSGKTATDEPSSDAAPVSEAAASADGVLQNVFNALTAEGSGYNEWKKELYSTTMTESIDGNTITISAKGDDGMNGDFVFTLDGDYLIHKGSNEDYYGYSFMMQFKQAVCDLYGMNETLTSGYLAAVGDDNKYFTTDISEGSATYKLYVAGEWDMDGIDDAYIDEQSVEYFETLSDTDTSNYVNKGKMTAAAIGNANDVIIFIGEYGAENTELTYKSLMSIVNKLQPAGYEAFAQNYTELKEYDENGVKVTFGFDAGTTETEYTPAADYSYITVTFTAA